MSIQRPPVVPVWGETNTSPADMIKPSDEAIQTGWPMSAIPPSRQRFNWLFNFLVSGIRYLVRRGISDYEATETYLIGDRVIGDDGATYKSLIDGNIGQPPSTSPTKWERWGLTFNELSAGQYAVDTGGVNTYRIALSPKITALTDGMLLRFKASTSNNGPSTLGVGNPGDAPIVRADHTAVQDGDIVADRIYSVVWNATAEAWVLATTQAPGRLLNIRKFTASGVYTPTPGTRAIVVELVGGGGAGGYAKATPAGQYTATAGGAAGGYAMSYLTAGFAGATVTVGAGGVAAATAVGVSGGTTSFGALLSATGGTGANEGDPVSVTVAGDVQSVPGPAGGVGVGGNLVTARGDDGGPGMYLTRPVGGAGGRSRFGAGGSQRVNTANTGNPAASPGAGGGGCGIPAGGAYLGGNGAGGIVIIWEYA